MKEEKKRREGGKKMDKKAIIKPDAHPRKEQQRHAEEANERPWELEEHPKAPKVASPLMVVVVVFMFFFVPIAFQIARNES